MPTIQHPDIRPFSGDATAGIHVIHQWEVVDNAARDSLTLVANDIGRVCRVGSSAPYNFFVLTNNVGPVWSALGGGGGGAVDSVFGRTGVVAAQSGDYTAAQVTGAVPDSRTITAGTGLTGGGDLTANRTLAVSFGTSSTTACVGDDSRLSDSRAPSGSAGGSLAGTYPNPTIASGVIGAAQIASAIIDPVAATAGLRTLGTSSTSACAGNDSRLSDSRAPNGSAGGDLGGTYPNPTVSVARGLRETSGPTNLTLGAVADGQVLVRSGSTLIGASAGDVTGPASATDNAVARFDSTTGKLIQSSGLTLSDAAGAGDTALLLGNTGVGVEIRGGLGSSGGPAGAITLDAGDPDGFSAAGITIGGTHASAVTLGRSGITTTVGGALIARVEDRGVSSDVTLSNTTDTIVRVDASGGNRTLTLPNPANRRQFLIKKTSTGTNTVTLARHASEQIEGTGASYLLPGSAGTGRPAWTVWSDGTNWWVA